MDSYWNVNVRWLNTGSPIIHLERIAFQVIWIAGTRYRRRENFCRQMLKICSPRISRQVLPCKWNSINGHLKIMTNIKFMEQDQYMDDESDRGSVISAMRKTKSIDASCLDMRSLGDVVNSSTMNMPRAKSEFNLTTTATIERKLFI